MIYKFSKNFMKEIGQERIIFILCLFVLGYGLICIQPYLLPQIVNKDSTISYVNFSLFLITLLVPSLLNYLSNFFVQITREVSKNLVFDFFKSQNYEYFLEFKSSELQGIVSEISFTCRAIAQEIVPVFIRASITVIMFAVFIGMQDKFLGVLYCILCIIYMTLSSYSSKKNRSNIQSAIGKTLDVNKGIDDYFKNIDSIYSYKMFRRESEIFRQKTKEEANIYYRVQKSIYNIYFCQQILLVGIISFLSLLWVNNFDYSRNPISFILVLIYSVLNLSSFGTDFLSGIELKDRLNIALSKIHYGIETAQHILEIDKREQSIHVRDLSFRFKHTQSDNKEVILDHVNLIFPLQKNIAILGGNGSGKTTLLKIVAGLFQPDEGKVTIPEGIKIIYVGQDSMIFNRSLKENLFYGVTEITSNTIKELFYLAKRLQINEIISKDSDLERELDGETFNSFSGGEKQKILILRSLISDADVILFDEITSGLDAVSATTFYKLIREYSSQKTFICITHRGEELVNFDIVVSL